MKKIYLFILILATIPSISLASSLPKFPMAFYGNVTINNKNAPEGTIIRVYCTRHADTVFGQSIVDSSGNYGYIDSLSKKLLVGECSGTIIFRFETPSILSGVESTGTTTLSYPEFEEGVIVNKDLAFTYKTTSSGGGGGGGGSSSSPSSKTNTTIPVSSQTASAKTTTIVNANNNTPSVNFTGIVKLGSKGETAKALQNILIEKGYLTGTADGSFGPMTLSAVKKFQEANGLIADGIVGPAVNAILNKMTNSVVTTVTPIIIPNTNSLPTNLVLRFGSNGNEVKEIQNKLFEKGFLSAVPNGNFGPATLKAVKAFQVTNGLVADGIVGSGTLNVLNK